jgi:ribonuclease P protein component
MSAPAPVRLRLSPAMRLQNKQDFTRVREKGCRMVKGCLIVNWMPLSAGLLSRIGVITGRKLGKATVRTRARRLLREAFRLHQHDLQAPVALVLIARSSILGKKLADVERDFLSLLRQAKLVKQIA